MLFWLQSVDSNVAWMTDLIDLKYNVSIKSFCHVSHINNPKENGKYIEIIILANPMLLMSRGGKKPMVF